MAKRTSKVDKFTVEITLGNAMMESREHVSAALHALASSLVDDSPQSYGEVRDLNGNKVGTWAATWPETEED